MQESTRRESQSRRSSYGLLMWLEAGLLGTIVSSLYAALGTWPGQAFGRAAVGASIGCAVLLLVMPWQRVAAWRRQQQSIHGLARALREAAHHRTSSPPELPAMTDTDLDQLIEAASDLLAANGAGGAVDGRTTSPTDDGGDRTARDRGSQTDALTGLLDRCGLEQWLSAAVEGSPTIVAVAIELDRLESINDSLGTEVGDQCLAFVGRILNSSVRTSDCAMRLGDNAFLVLLKGASLDAGLSLGRRAQALLSRMPWEHASPRARLSFGVAEGCVEDGDAARRLIRRADTARSRTSGRGRAA